MELIITSLTESELKFVLEDPECLLQLMHYHQCQETMAEGYDPGSGENHRARGQAFCDQAALRQQIIDSE